ncbi:MAG: hypothetical protein ABIG42_03625 [bacterium]
MRYFAPVIIIFIAVFFISCGGGGGDPIIPTDDLVLAGKTALNAGDGTTAKTNFQAALAQSGNNPDANFGMAFVELMGSANDILLFLSAQNDPYFRNVGWFFVDPLMKNTGQYSELLDLSRLLSYTPDYDVEDISLEAVRLKIVEVLGKLEIIDGYLEKAISATNIDDSWQFTVLKDWNEPTAGQVQISHTDLIALSSVLKFALATGYLSVAYSPGQLTIHQNEWGELEILGFDLQTEEFTDTNQDSFVDLHEIATQAGISADFGVHAPNGSSHLNKSVNYFRNSITYFRDAVDGYLSTDAPLTHWAFDSDITEDYNEFKADWNSYTRAYVGDIINAFTDGATFGIRPGLLEDSPDLADDPGADFSIRLNLNDFIKNLPQDARNFPVRFVADGFGGLELPALVNDAFPDTTILGLFPDGLTQEQYDMMY